MFNQSKIDGRSADERPQMLSPSLNKHSLKSGISHSAVTSARSTFRRYSLADAKLSSPETKHLCTKFDSKSPGFSTRVVQYNAEQEKSLPVNYSKYDTFGVFPIVHIFKKDLPRLKRKPSDVTDYVDSLQLSKYNSPEHNQMLLEKIIKSSVVRENNAQRKDTNPKSVLDALKEISRKRIHSNEEEFILKDDGKRVHVVYDIESTSKKRLKQSLSQSENSVTSNPSRKRSSIDEVMASQSSTSGSLCELPKENNANRTKIHKPSSPVKYVNVETQTSAPQVTATAQVTPIIEKVEKKFEKQLNETKEIKKKKMSPVKIFDETPLETMRRNRLTALMGSLVSNKKQDNDSSSKSEKIAPEKPLVSILAGSTKSPGRSNKHVTFDLPELTTNLNTCNTLSPAVLPNTQCTASSLSMTTKTSAAILTPIVSASITESPFKNKMLNEVSPEALLKNSEEATVLSTITVDPTVATSTSPNQSIPRVTQLFTKNKENEESDKLTFTSASSQSEMSVSSYKSSEPAGFKFKLTTTESTTFTPLSIKLSETAASNSSATNETVSSPMALTSSKETFSTQSSYKLSSTFSNSTGVVPSSSTSSSSTTTTTSQLSNISATISSNFLSVPIVRTSDPSATPIVTKNLCSVFETKTSNMTTFSTPVTKSSLFSFISTSGATHSVPSTNSFNFTPTSTHSQSSSSTNFLSPSSVSTTVCVQSNNSFVSSTPSIFNKPINNLGTTPSLSHFPTTVSKTGGNSTFSFGSSNLSFNSNLSNTTNFGGGDSSTKSAFGQGTDPVFGITTTGASLSTINTNVFGNNANNIFGNTSSFGPSTTSSFSSNSTISFVNSNFNANQNPAFGSDLKNNVPFGTLSNTPFCASTSTPAFSSNTATFSTVNGFSSGNTFSHAKNNTFSSTFGVSSSLFDKSSTNSEAPSFGSSTSTFGANNFPVNSPNSQNNAFNFAPSNDVSVKPPVFSFGASEPPKPTFNFTKNNNSTAFGANNKQFFGSNSPVFSSVPNQFNVQPTGGTMFNIGTGGSSSPSRSRVQHKTKRRP